MKKILPFACIPLLAIFLAFGNPQKTSATYNQWLDKKNVGHTIKISAKGSKDSFSVHYFGDVQSLKKETFKVVGISFSTEKKQSANAKLMFFNSKNELVGGYYIGSASDLPTGISHNRLVFDYKLSKNPCQSITKVDFFKGIPPRLFVSCQGREATIYEFYPEMKAERINP